MPKKINGTKEAVISCAVFCVVFFVFSLFSCSVQKKVDLSRMAYIPEGEFLMGITDEDSWKIVETDPSMSRYDWFEDEKPKHKVWLDAFYMDKYEVTNAEFQKFVEMTNYQAEGDWQVYYSEGHERYPVLGVTWNDANAYAAWVGKRLPTEAEWEKAAKSDQDFLYPWGTDFEKGKENCQTKEVRPVGSFPANNYGIYDLGGNALEWCSDWYDKDYYKNNVYKNPKGPEEGEFRVVRGGAWFFNCAYYSHTSNRHYVGEISRSSFNIVGFRCAYSAKR